MPDWKDYNAQRTRLRLVVTLDPTTLETLAGLAARRFGGNRSLAVEWAVIMAAAILADPRTMTATDPADALAAFTGRQN